MKTPVSPTTDTTARWGSGGRSPARAPAPGFSAAVSAVQGQGAVTVRAGDNLTHLVKAQARAQGQSLDESTAYRLALQVAQANGIAQADRIVPGQQLDLGLVHQHLSRGPLPNTALGAVSSQTWLAQKGVLRPQPAPSQAQQATDLGSGEVLERTLQRAVHKGFLPAEDQAAVRARIEALADKYGFSADDFALLSLMESDGLNPQASNGSCHGVIQFCEGPNRGAASVGMAEQPRAILGMGVLRQLDLVDRYLADAGVQRGAGLDDLYLAVLTPAARAQTALDAPLPIAGRQAAALYVARDPSGVITRRSLTQGLLDNAAARLGLSVAQLDAMRKSEASSQVAMGE